MSSNSSLQASGGGGGGAVTVADGADVTLGSKGDTADTTATNSDTLVAFTKGLVKILASVWNSTLNGLQTVRVATTLFSTAQTTVGTANSGDLTVGPYDELGIDITTTAQAGTNPTIQFFWDRKGADGIYYHLWQSSVLTAAANTISTSIGPGLAYNQSLGVTGRLSWVVGGSATPTWTFTPNVYAK